MLERIEIHPDICNGRPVVRGTRIAVEFVLGLLAAGDSVAEVLLVNVLVNRIQSVR